MKKLLMLLMCVLLLAGCSNNAGGSSSSDVDTIKVGVVQLVQHEALDAATKGFEDVLKESFGDKVVVDIQNASGEPTNCTTIVNGFVSNGVNLIMANATPALQAAASATGDIAVLGTSITDYGSALDIDNFNGTVGTNVSGTSDLAPLDQQALMVKELFPEAKKVGIIFCSSEANSAYQVEVITKELTNLGFEVKEFSFTDTNDISSVTQSACDFADVIYIPTDNTAASNTEAIANVVLPAGVPVIAGEEGIAKGCGVATLSISYYDLGRVTGQMAVDILNGKDVSTMPIEYASSFTKKFNPSNCEQLNITVPEGYEAIE